MSSSSHADAVHAPHDAHAFDGEPATELPADEPPTPGWLPALGGALFLAAAIGYVATLDKSGDKSGDDDSASAAADHAAVAAPPPVPAAPQPTPRARQAADAAPSHSGAYPMPADRLKELRDARAGGAAPQPIPVPAQSARPGGPRKATRVPAPPH